MHIKWVNSRNYDKDGTMKLDWVWVWHTVTIFSSKTVDNMSLTVY